MASCAAPQTQPVEVAAPVAAVVVAAQPAGSSIAIAAKADPPESCSKHLTVGELKKSETCFVDEKVTGTEGILEYPCNGGPAEARFGQTVFSGEFVGGTWDVRVATEFDFNDGCHWRSEQRIGSNPPGLRSCSPRQPAQSRSHLQTGPSRLPEPSDLRSILHTRHPVDQPEVLSRSASCPDSQLRAGATPLADRSRHS